MNSTSRGLQPPAGVSVEYIRPPEAFGQRLVCAGQKASPFDAGRRPARSACGRPISTGANGLRPNQMAASAGQESFSRRRKTQRAMHDLGQDRMGDKLTKARRVFQMEGLRGLTREAFWFPYRRATSMLAAIRGQQCLRIGKVALLFHVQSYVQSYAEALHLIQTFQTESECLRYLANHLHEGDVFWDVGAYHGLYTMLAARLGGKVIAFEPYGANAQRIQENARLNRCEDHIQVMTLALSDRHGMASFDVRGGQRSFMMGHITDDPRSALNVRTVPGDSLVASGISAPDIVKIDVEGHELHVLWGMQETLRHHVRAMICEVHAEYLARHGKSGSVERCLQSLGFRVFRIRDRGTEYFLAAERVNGP